MFFYIFMPNFDWIMLWERFFFLQMASIYIISLIFTIENEYNIKNACNWH